ncbi:hypothetical protein ACU635_33460 [[Actinomadura] parvosata]|uniref:hypothetical protein n=1 Tax=[Actinomadura] parvosata TaxID=1955412 RepID=UPI00406CA4A2
MNSLPRKPKLHPGLAAVPYEHGLVLEGTAQRRSFGGKAARTFLPRLLPLLDGTRTREDLAAELGHGTEQALQLLHTTGHLQDGDGDPELPQGVPLDVAQAVGRALGTSGTWPNPEAAFQAMHTSPALIVDSGSPAARVADLLTGSGDRVTTIPAEHVPGDGAFVVVVSEGEEDTDVLERLDAACFDRGVVWLRIRLAGQTLRLGPCFDRRFTPCVGCFRAAADEPAAGPPDADLAELGWAIAAGEIFHRRAGIGTPLAAGVVSVFDLRAWSSHQYLVPKRAGCRRCV